MIESWSIHKLENWRPAAEKLGQKVTLGFLTSANGDGYEYYTYNNFL